MEEQLHLASQYLAAAGISFVTPKDDDSHTNLGFDPETKSMETRLLSKEVDVLTLSYNKFSLEWHSFIGNAFFELDGKTHKEVLQWLEEISSKRLGKTYTYNLHYELPYTIDDNYTYKLESLEKLQHLCNLRVLAAHTFENFVESNSLNTEIRVWPHHFDTGGFASIDNTEVSIGFGLAIPDSVCNHHYFYSVGYKDNQVINTESFENLSKGTWLNSDFKGAILPAVDIEKAEAIQFFQETLKQFKN